MSVELIEIGGMEAAIHGMRNPTKTNDKSDSYDDYGFIIGDKDLKLAKSLVKKGDDHGKFTRGIIAYLDITAPRYIWAELDTYTVGSIPISSESTIYTLVKEAKGKFTFDMFEHIDGELLNYLNDSTRMLLSNYENGDITFDDVRLSLKQHLPESFLQRRTRGFSYQTLRRIYLQRKDHPMPFWKEFREFIESLPYAKELIIGEE